MCSPNFSPLNSCLACESENLKLTLDLGKQPPANSYKDRADEPQEEFPLAINRCLDCYHVQLTGVVNPDILYKNYLYVSGTSQTMKDHMKWFADYAEELHKNYRPWDRGDLELKVLDIGCNDGSQLDAFKSIDYITYGFDPAENLHTTSMNKGHKVLCEYFNLATSNAFLANNIKFDIITAQNVFAHNPDPQAFLFAARRLMYDESFLFIQTSQADMILNNEFDTIYHEHISFYNINSMNELCKRSALYLHDVIKCPLHGNSYIFVISRDPERERRYHIANLIEMERKAGLMSEQTYIDFAANAKVIAGDLKELVEDHTRNEVGWFAIGYGAAAKGMTLLNYSKAKLDFIVDDNPLKQGKFTPGMSIPILSPDELKEHKDACLLVPLAWNFFDEIKNKIRQKKPYNKYDKYVRYFPEVKAEEDQRFYLSPGVQRYEIDLTNGQHTTPDKDENPQPVA